MTGTAMTVTRIRRPRSGGRDSRLAEPVTFVLLGKHEPPLKPFERRFVRLYLPLGELPRLPLGQAAVPSYA
jgi:hypothetical protein